MILFNVKELLALMPVYLNPDEGTNSRKAPVTGVADLNLKRLRQM